MGTRRNFLKTLGLAPVALAAPAAIAETGLVSDQEKLVQWICDCGAQVYAKRPVEVGESVAVQCPLGHRFALTWQGTCYSYRKLNNSNFAVGTEHIVQVD